MLSKWKTPPVLSHLRWKLIHIRHPSNRIKQTFGFNATSKKEDILEPSRRYDLTNRIDIPTEDECFITVKNHKAGFPGKVECRLINPAHIHLESISKHLLDNADMAIREKTKLNQWQSTSAAILWLKTIQTQHKLIQVQHQSLLNLSKYWFWSEARAIVQPLCLRAFVSGSHLTYQDKIFCESNPIFFKQKLTRKQNSTYRRVIIFFSLNFWRK